MEKEFSPQQGFDTINAIIQEAKSRFEEDGLIYIMWGILTSVAAFGQYYMIQNGMGEICYYPYFLMPIGAIVSTLYYRKKAKGKMNHVGRIQRATWIFVSINAMVLGFGLAWKMGPSLIPTILLLLSVGTLVSGTSIRSKILIFSGILMNSLGIVAFFVDYEKQPLMMGFVGLFCVLLPGILLYIKQGKK